MSLTQTDTQLDIHYEGRPELYTGVLFLVIALLGFVILELFKFSGYTQGASFIDFILILAFVGGGAFVILGAHSSNNTLRKDGTTTITTTRYIGGKTITHTFGTAEITGVEYLTTYTNIHRAGYRAGSHVSILLRDNTKVILLEQLAHSTLQQILFLQPANEPLLAPATQVAAFLKLPLSVKDLSVRALLRRR
jgi:hypothetical protein